MRSGGWRASVGDLWPGRAFWAVGDPFQASPSERRALSCVSRRHGGRGALASSPVPSNLGGTSSPAQSTTEPFSVGQTQSRGVTKPPWGSPPPPGLEAGGEERGMRGSGRGPQTPSFPHSEG